MYLNIHIFLKNILEIFMFLKIDRFVMKFEFLMSTAIFTESEYFWQILNVRTPLVLPD